ncbi:uncharacterized protein LOC134825448 [Bolinopsis microptera]|uniref:uncharacterized protein LOC134825448 n=1 Tax=Bolinopsis microptera TaxID=2820187 RepID=UPI0030795936
MRMREILRNEVYPVGAELSRTYNDNEKEFGAWNALDRDLMTRSYFVAASDGSVWIKLILEQVTCVDQVVWYKSDGPFFTWTCSKTDCTCQDDSISWCDLFSLTVSNEGIVDNVPSVSRCKYGDTVKIERIDHSESYVDNMVFDISVTEIRGMRDIMVSEVFPVRAELSRTLNDDEEEFGAANTLDRDLMTRSYFVADSDGSVWIKLILEQVTCVDQVVWYKSDGPFFSWTCSKTGCTCQDDSISWACDLFSLTVSNEGIVDNVPSVSRCKYGDTVKIERIDHSESYVDNMVFDISVTEKKGMRPILVDEVFPVRAEQSRTKDDNKKKNGAHLAIDLNLLTRSVTYPGAGGSIWFKVTLDQVSCVDQIVSYFRNDGRPSLTWTCSKAGCSCNGRHCNKYSLTVYREGAVDSIPSVPDCKYGDTVKIERTDNTGSSFLNEISVTEKKVGEQGELGAEGEKGRQGETGEKGAQGTNDFCSSVSGICSLEGAEGEPGEPGFDGLKGATGDSGYVGEIGEQGLGGDDGVEGYNGGPGIKGENGGDGEDGISGSIGEQDCEPESCGLRLGHCYGMGSSRFTVQCMEGYAANGIWRNSRFWGLRCCKIIVK